jgi:hypothetical protein
MKNRCTKYGSASTLEWKRYQICMKTITLDFPGGQSFTALPVRYATSPGLARAYGRFRYKIDIFIITIRETLPLGTVDNNPASCADE